MINKKRKNFYTFRPASPSSSQGGPASTQGGTSLIELMVVIFIFVVITGVTIFNYGKFNSSISIQNLADDIALTIRRAQGYAIGVRGYGESFSGGYGIHFSPQALTLGQEYKGSNKSFVLFTDMTASPNKKYDYSAYNGCGSPAVNDECIEILNILGTDQISAITVNDGGASPIVVPSAGTVEILFYRPNPEPIFCYRSDVSHSSCDLVGTEISNLKITITNTRGTETITKEVTVANNGQISVSSLEN